MIHETQGLFTFGIAFLLLLLEAWVLQMARPQRGGSAASAGKRMTKLFIAALFLA